MSRAPRVIVVGGLDWSYELDGIMNGYAIDDCGGNGILLDISQPASPKRLDYVADKNFAYWHSATLKRA